MLRNENVNKLFTTTLPWLVFILSLSSGLYFVYYYNQTWKKLQLENLNKIALTTAFSLERHIEKTLSSAYILGSIIRQQGGQTDSFEIYAEDIIHSIGNITNLQLAPDDIIKYIYPLKGHEKALGHNLIRDDARKKESKLAIATKKMTLAGPFELIQGGIGIIGRFPIFLPAEDNNEYFWGFSSVLIFLDDILTLASLNNSHDKFEYQLSRIHPDTGKLEIFSGKKQLRGVASTRHEINVPNGKWFVSIYSKSATSESPAFYIIIAIVTVVSLLLFTIIYFLLRQPAKLKEMVATKTEELKKLASHDSLTGLINRYEFERRADRLLTTVQYDKTEHAVCYLDLDQFKVVNDTCGHIAGDELLRQLATILRHAVRKRDTLARLGGDEFGILMEHCPLSNAKRVAAEVQKAVHDYQFSWEEHTFRVGVSIGLVVINETTPNLTELLKCADAACYMAKDLGRNRTHVYRYEDLELAQRHGEMQWIERIHNGMEEDRFCLYAQPIEALGRCNKNSYYELLIRMEDKGGQIILPGAFLPAAERYNVITKIDRWVIKKAFTLLAENPVFFNQINTISINLSGQSITELEILDFIITQLDETGIGGDKICFEITETATIANLSAAMKFISTLKGLGCLFALDDFGSGLSSFAYLKNLNVDYLKIDGMFVKDIVVDPIDHAMVKSINEIGQVMGMQTIAEFVENDEIKDMLREIGVNYAQGYAIGKPMLFDELLDRSK